MIRLKSERMMIAGFWFESCERLSRTFQVCHGLIGAQLIRDYFLLALGVDNLDNLLTIYSVILDKVRRVWSTICQSDLRLCESRSNRSLWLDKPSYET